MKLKTLKDFRPLEFKLEKYVGFEFSVEAWKLRAEAIKWVKELRKQAKETPKDKIVNFEINDRIALHDSVTRETYNVIEELWIKHFFNITEEDLK